MSALNLNIFVTFSDIEFYICVLCSESKSPMGFKKSFGIWVFFFCGEGPRSRSYGRTAALRLIMQPYDEDEEQDDQFFFIFQSNGAPVD